MAIRIRPFIQRELDCGETEPVVTVDQYHNCTAQTQPAKTFPFDYTYAGPEDSPTDPNSQETVYRDIGSVVVEGAINGYNGSLFAYGQTGSGKSYTVMGYGQRSGLIPRSIADVFQRKEDMERDAQKEMIVQISYVEIYNENVRDLLASGDQGGVDLKIIDHPKVGVCVTGLTEAVCNNAADAQKLLAYGIKRRVTGVTMMNAASSRSHAVFIMKIQNLDGPRPPAGQQDNRRELLAKINLTDLAGSERQAKAGSEGQLLREGCAINQSLSTLALIIKDLSENANRSKSSKQVKVAFRASKLTFLLKDSLAGNSRTYMVACVSPAKDNLQETLTTLRFAASVKKIKTTATQNKASRDEVIGQLQDEIRRLREQLAEQASDTDACPELTQLEGLLEYTTKGYGSGEKHSALADNGLSNDEISEAFHVDRNTPYLLNMSDDPMVAGCLIYYLSADELMTVGTDPDNKIALRGIGIPNLLCEFLNTGNTEVTVTKMSENGRLCINGKLLGTGEKRRLANGDKIYIGRSFGFKLLLPAEFDEGGMRGQGSHAGHGLSLHGLEDEWTAIEDSSRWSSLQEYLDQVMQQIPEDQAICLEREMKKGWKLCEEANEITQECRSKEGLIFEVDLTSSLPSSVVIRVLKEETGESGGADGFTTLYLWSVHQAAERLERMRDYCEEHMRNGATELDPLLDPWHEPHPGAIVRRLAEMDIMVQAEREHLYELRENTMKTMRKSFVTWFNAGEDMAAFMRLVWAGWCSFVKDARHIKEKQKQRASGRRLSTSKAVQGAKAAPKSPAVSKSLTKAFGKSPVRMGERADDSSSASPTSPQRAERSFSMEAGQSPLGSSQQNRFEGEEPELSPTQKDHGLSIKQKVSSPIRSAGYVHGPEADRASQILRSAVEETSLPGAVPCESPTVGEATDNESLRKQLEAAWQLCNVLSRMMQDRGQRVEEEESVPKEAKGKESPVMALGRSSTDQSPVRQLPVTSTAVPLLAMPQGTTGSPRICARSQSMNLSQVAGSRVRALSPDLLLGSPPTASLVGPSFQVLQSLSFPHTTSPPVPMRPPILSMPALALRSLPTTTPPFVAPGGLAVSSIRSMASRAQQPLPNFSTLVQPPVQPLQPAPHGVVPQALAGSVTSASVAAWPTTTRVERLQSKPGNQESSERERTVPALSSSTGRQVEVAPWPSSHIMGSATYSRSLS